MVASALGYPQHQNEAVVAGTLGGVTSVVLAATWKPIAAYRTVFNFGGCAVMLGSQYLGDKIAKDKAKHNDSGS